MIVSHNVNLIVTLIFNIVSDCPGSQSLGNDSDGDTSERAQFRVTFSDIAKYVSDLKKSSLKLSQMLSQ